MTRREYLATLFERMVQAIVSKEGGTLDDLMTMADAGVAAMAMGDLGAEIKGRLPRLRT